MPEVTNGDAVEVVARWLVASGYIGRDCPTLRREKSCAMCNETAEKEAAALAVRLSDHVREHGPVVLGDGVVATTIEPSDNRWSIAQSLRHPDGWIA